MAAMTIPRTQTFDAPREHRSFRLSAQLITVLEDLATGVEAGDSGLKSCALGALSGASLGASAAEVNVTHHREVAVIDDEDECFNAMGDLLAQGFCFAEVANMVTLGGGATHLLALERWCDRVRLRCFADGHQPTDLTSLPWRGSAMHERRRRGRRAIAALRATPRGVTHASVLYVTYGWHDPFVRTLSPEVVVELGPEFARLARYTDVVETHRVGMAHAEAMRGTAMGVVELGDHRARLARADRCLTSADALRSATAPPRARREDETKEHYREHVYLPARDARSAFLTAVKRDADHMLVDASFAFGDAWLGS